MKQQKLSKRDLARYATLRTRFDRVAAPIVKAREASEVLASQLERATVSFRQVSEAYASSIGRMTAPQLSSPFHLLESDAADRHLKRVMPLIRSVRPIAEVLSAARATGPVSPPRLVFVGAPPRVALDGVEKKIAPQMLKLLVILAKNVAGRRPFVSGSAIESEFGGRPAADVVRELRSWLRKNTPGDDVILIEMRGRPLRYRLDLRVGDVRFEP
jgi:hypothetical protein